MTKKLVVLDYGSGNLRSAQRALERVGADVEVTSDAAAAAAADGLVVPGVGAYEACMTGLRSIGGEKIIAWWEKMGRDPKEKLLIFSDGLDVDTIIQTYRHFEGRVRMSFGWGTNLTNDFAGCAPIEISGLNPISIVCKVADVNGRPAVKLSDNPRKATGEPSEVERYIKYFGTEDFTELAVKV